MSGRVTLIAENSSPDLVAVDAPVGTEAAETSEPEKKSGDKSGFFTLPLGFELFNLGNAVVAGVSPEPIPILPSFNFSGERLKLNFNQDRFISAIELGNATLTNIFSTRDLVSPRNFRTDGIAGLGVLATNDLLNSAHTAGLYRGMLASQQNDNPWFRSLTMGNAGWRMVYAGIKINELRNSSNYLCSPWQAENFTGQDQTCNDAVSGVANGGDAVLSNAFGTTASSTSAPPVEGLDGALAGLKKRAIGSENAAYGAAASAFFNAAESGGKPTLWSAAILAPLVIEPVIATQSGQPFNGADWAERFAISGGAFALSTGIKDPRINIAASNNYGYLLSSTSVPAMLEATTLHLKDYDNPNSAFMLTPFASVGSYGLDSFSAGTHSGRSFRLADKPFEKFAPLALNVGGHAFQAVANAENGDPSLWKYLGFGIVASAAGFGLGYATAPKDDSKPIPGRISLEMPELSVGPNGGSVALNGHF